MHFLALLLSLQAGRLVEARLAGDHTWRIEDMAGGHRDFVSLAQDPGHVTYELALGDEVAGLRLVDNVLELIDAGGAPRLRVYRAALVDANGASHAARLAVRDCRVDENPAAPFGRAPVSPGSRRCFLDVSWPPGALFPAVLDPTWTATTNMAVTHENHGAAPLPGGRVLVFGSYATTTTSEIYDPDSDSWAMTGPLPTGFGHFMSTVLDDGSVLAIGHCQVTACTSAGSDKIPLRYSPTTGTWSPAGSLNHAVLWGGLVTLGDGRALLAGGNGTQLYVGYAGDVLLYDPAANFWTSTGSLKQARELFGMALLSDGRVLAAGGAVNMGTSTMDLDSSEIYDPAAGTWSDGAKLPKARSNIGMAAVAGGAVAMGTSLDLDPWFYDATKNVWMPSAGNLATHNSAPVLSLPGGGALTAGGAYATASAEWWNPSSQSWESAGAMRMVRYNHTVTLCLKSGQLAALAAGGDGPEFHVADAYQTADLLLLDSLPGYNFVPDLATAGSIDPNPMISDAGGVVNDGSVVGDGGVSDDFGSIVLMRNHASTQSGCDCDMGGTTPPSGWWVLPLFLALGTLRRRALRKDW